MKTPCDLGYNLNDSDFVDYYYKFDGDMTLIIKENGKIKNQYYGYVIPRCDINSQKVIDDLQIAYNNLKRDLEELNNGK